MVDPSRSAWSVRLTVDRCSTSTRPPADDEIVPPRLVQWLALRLPSAVVEATGTHAWLTDNWSTVLGRM